MIDSLKDKHSFPQSKKYLEEFFIWQNYIKIMMQVSS